jgi:hypothetical protein
VCDTPSSSLTPPPLCAFERRFLHHFLKLALEREYSPTITHQARNDAKVKEVLIPKNRPNFRFPIVQVSLSCILTTPAPKNVFRHRQHGHRINAPMSLTAIDVAGKKNNVTNVMMRMEIASCCVLFAMACILLVIFSISVVDFSMFFVIFAISSAEECDF